MRSHVYNREQPMAIPREHKEYLFSLWDAADEQEKRTIAEEFRKKYKGTYTQKDFLDFIEQHLVHNSAKVSLQAQFSK